MIRDPDLTRADLLALHREVRRAFGTTGRRGISTEGRVFQRQVHLVARAFARGRAGGPEPDFETRFWTLFRQVFPGSPSLQALGMRWRTLKRKLALDRDEDRSRQDGDAPGPRAGPPRDLHG